MFGQQQPAFGGFGQSQSQPAFGASASSSPFGGTSAFGAQPSPFGAPAGGAGVFGQASQPAFGAASTPAFGGQQSQGGLFGGTAFGAKPAGGFSFGSSPAFGASASSTPAFGQAQSTGFGAFGAASTPAFGAPAASTPAFGAASMPSFGGFGASSTPAFGAASSTPAFGTPGSAAGSPFGTPGSAFGASPASGGFGTPQAAAPAAAGSGSRAVQYQKFADKEVGSGTQGSVQIFYNSISAMPQYLGQSFEELRFEDYAAGVKNQNAAPAPAAAPAFGASPGTTSTPTGFGFGAAASSSPGFGASTAGSVFGQASAASPFGGTSTPAFGAAASPSPFGGGFGTSTPTSTPAFGGFGASAPATGGGLFGTASQPAASSTFSFGGGAPSQPAFGATSSPGFGAPASQPAFGGTAFGAPASSSSIFGASSSPAFGGSSPFGASATPNAFGTPSSSPFGAAAPAAGGFGASSGGFAFSTPSASKPATGGFAFGGTGGFGAPASSGAGIFGANSSPAFGASTGGALFGSSQASPGSSLFGGGGGFGAAPATGGGLFGAASAPAASFSFAPQAGTPGAFGAPSAAPVQPPGVAQQPYGALQPLPQVNMPEQVPVNQRPVRPSVTTTRPSLRMTPRTAMPKFGLGASAGLARSAGKNAAGNSAYVLSGSPGSTDRGAGSPAAAMLLPARDNPHRLFIRSPPPSTAAAANGSSLSPARGQADDIAQTPVRTPQQQRVPRTAERQQEAPASNGLQQPPADRAAEPSPKPAANGSAQAGGKAAAAAEHDEEGGLVPRLGQLRDEGYSMRPSQKELQALAARDPSALHNVKLVIERAGYGRLEWLQPVDVSGLDLQDIIQIDRGSVAVYYNDGEDSYKPPEGVGLNRPCKVVLTGVYKKNKPQSDPAVVSAFSNRLRRYCNDMAAKFMSYEPNDGVWTFEVDHFSRYGLPSESDDEADEQEPMQLEPSGSGAQGTASQQEPTLGFGNDADMQAEADDADTQQQPEQQDAAAAAAAGYSEPPLQHMLPGLLGHDAGALLEQKGAFFHRGGAVAGSDFEFAAVAGRGTDVMLRQAAAVPPSFARTHGAAASAGRYGRSPYDASVYQDDQEFVGQGQSLEHNWVRKRPALLQSVQQQRRRDQQRAVIRPDDEQQQEQQQQQRPVGGAAGSALLVRPVGLQDLQLQLGKAAAAPSAMQQQSRSAAITPLLPATAVISSSAAAVDAALMLGRSFRAGWGPKGQLVVPCNPRCNSSSSGSSGQQQQQQQVLPCVELRQLSPLASVSLPGSSSSSSSSSTAGQAAAVAGMQERVLSGLQLHLDHSQPTDASAAAGGAWQLVCDSRAVGGYVSNQLAVMDAAASAASVAAARSRDVDSSSSSSSTAVDAAGCTDHLRQLWKLLQLLFEYIEGQSDDLDDSTAAAGFYGSDADMGEGQEGYGMVDGAAPAKQFALAAMQRKANLSKWLQLKLRPQVMDALSAILADSRRGKQQQEQQQDVLWAVLHLAAGRQLKAAAALAASVGDVRLASLLASVNTAAHGRHGQLLLQQITVWRSTGILPKYVCMPRIFLLTLLTAAVGGSSDGGVTEQSLVGVAEALGLDWSGALGLWTWYKVPMLESVPSTTVAFTTAMAARQQLARPAPPHTADPALLLEPHKAAKHPAFTGGSSGSTGGSSGSTGGGWTLVPAAAAAAGGSSGGQGGQGASSAAATTAVLEGGVAAVADSQYALLQLDARGCRNLATALLNTTEEGYTDVDVDTLVARLLRPAGHTPNPLDYSTAWQLLQVLKALDKLPEDDSEYVVASSAIASSLIAQLLLLGPQAVPWAAFVALHITHRECRQAALQQLLQVTAPTWARDAAVVGWLRDTLGLPLAWMHTAQAVWYGSNHRPALTLLHLMAAGSWQEAHKLACTELLPMLALATTPHGGVNRGGSTSSKSSKSSSNSSIAGQVLSVLADFKAAAVAFLATVSPEAADEAEQQAAEAYFWQAPDDLDDASLAADGFGGNSMLASPRMQAYCVAAAAYVAATCVGAGDAPAAEAAGLTLRALCSVLAVQEGSLGSAWNLGGGVYAGWCGAMLGAAGSFADPTTAAAAAAAEGAMAEGAEEVTGEDVLQVLQYSTQRCLRLADLLADAASAVRTTAGRGSWWGAPVAQLTLSHMTAAVGRALVRLGIASRRMAGGGGSDEQGVGGGSNQGLLMMGGDQGIGQMLAAAAALAV